MPWKIEHVCDPSDPEPKPYSIMRGERAGMPLTRIICPKLNCREEFFILGHEMFGQAESNEDRQPGRGLPPGFVIATRKSG